MCGFVAETNATHLFLVESGVVRTPFTSACPEGITRATVLELCETNDIPHKVRGIPHAELFEADEMFVTGTMGELVPVVRLDGRVFKPGPVMEKLTRLFTRLVASRKHAAVVVGD